MFGVHTALFPYISPLFPPLSIFPLGEHDIPFSPTRARARVTHAFARVGRRAFVRVYMRVHLTMYVYI